MLLLGGEQCNRGVIAASAGNHAQGLSYHGKQAGHSRHDRHAAHHARW
jgi:threonine dehydratase